MTTTVAGSIDGLSGRRGIERSLARRWQAGDERARDQLLAQLLPLAGRIARRYATSAHDLDDLEQVARIGLLKAIDRFEPDRGVLLSTYAAAVVTGEVKRWFRDSSWAVKVPRAAKELSVRVETALPNLTARLGRSPTITEIADAVGADHESVLEALEARSAAAVASLDQALEEGEDPLLDAAVEDPEFTRAEQRAALEPALRTLTPRERRVLELRFGDGLTQAEIGARLGISQMQVSRILRRALDRAAVAAR